MNLLVHNNTSYYLQNGSHWAKIEVLARLRYFLKALCENIFLCFLQLLEVFTVLGSQSHFSLFRASNARLSLSCCHSFASLFLFQEPLWLHRPTQIIQDNLTILRAADYLLCANSKGYGEMYKVLRLSANICPSRNLGQKWTKEWIWRRKNKAEFLCSNEESHVAGRRNARFSMIQMGDAGRIAYSKTSTNIP